MPINPIPQPVDVIINPSGEPPKIKHFIINAPLIVQSTNVKNKLDTITKETDNLSTRLSALESSIDSNITNISSNASGSFFFSNSPNIIETSGSLYLSGAVKSSYISSSTGAYITGSVTQGYSGNIASGNYSHAEGQATVAYGAGSHAEGYQTNASGDYCHAEGENTYVTIQGDWGHAEGRFTKVDNRYAHTEGYLTTGSGEASHAEGNNTTANGNFSHAEGYYTKTESTGLYAHAEGYLTTGSGEASHAEGERTRALNFGSHAEGFLTVANSNGSHSEGYQSYTFSLVAPDKLGYSAHAEGRETSVCGNYAHAEGYQTHASGAHSHAEGDNTVTIGASSHAGGQGTIASGSYQTVVGSYNNRLNTTSLFIIGNGTADSDALRGDIFRAENTGELVLSGGIRHSFLNSSIGTTLMDRKHHIWVFDTFEYGGNISVTLPEINDRVKDIGLTVVIRQNDADAPGGRNVTIRPGILEAFPSYTSILGFNTEFTNPAGMVLSTLGGTKSPAYYRRSITLTYTGRASNGNYRWTVMATSEC